MEPKDFKGQELKLFHEGKKFIPQPQQEMRPLAGPFKKSSYPFYDDTMSRRRIVVLQRTMGRIKPKAVRPVKLPMCLRALTFRRALALVTQTWS